MVTRLVISLLPLFFFGIAEIPTYRKRQVLKWATRIAERYVGKKNAKAYGERNNGEGEVLVQIKPTKIIAQKDTASWN